MESANGRKAGGIHGRLLTAWSTAGVLGPVAITQLRQGSMENAIENLVSKNGSNKVLFIQHTGKEKCSMVGDQIAQTAAENGWEGIITNGYIRDIEVIKDIPIGVYAKNTYPKKTDKSIGVGEVGVALDFETMIIKEGAWIYVDSNGWVISEKKLEI